MSDDLNVGARCALHVEQPATAAATVTPKTSLIQVRKADGMKDQCLPRFLSASVAEAPKERQYPGRVMLFARSNARSCAIATTVGNCVR